MNKLLRITPYKDIIAFIFELSLPLVRNWGPNLHIFYNYFYYPAQKSVGGGLTGWWLGPIIKVVKNHNDLRLDFCLFTIFIAGRLNPRSVMWVNQSFWYCVCFCFPTWFHFIFNVYPCPKELTINVSQNKMLLKWMIHFRCL